MIDIEKEFDTVLDEFRDLNDRGLTFCTDSEIRNVFGKIGWLNSYLTASVGQFIHAVTAKKLQLDMVERKLIIQKYDAGAMTLRSTQAKNDPIWVEARMQQLDAEEKLTILEAQINALNLAHSTLSRESSYRLKA
jgi:hypothetical protein